MIGSYRLYGAGLAVAGVAVVGAVVTLDNAINYTQATGAIVRIDRICQFHTAVRHTLPEGTRVLNETTREDCNATGELAALLNQGALPTRKVDGNATVSVSFPSPVDGAPRTASYVVDGRNNSFYTLRVGAHVTILVHKREPSRIKPI